MTAARHRRRRSIIASLRAFARGVSPAIGAALSGLRRDDIAVKGVGVSLALQALAFAVATTLVIASTYAPILIWWLMFAGMGASMLRHIAMSHRRMAGDQPPQGDSVSIHQLSLRGRQFRRWFIEHNLLCTTVACACTLLLWHRFGAQIAALTVMAAFMACGVFGVLGVLAGERTRALAIGWTVECPMPSFAGIRDTLASVGITLILRDRTQYAREVDWRTGGGPVQDLMLMVEQTSRAGNSAQLALTAPDPATADDPAAVDRERICRACALLPLFVATLLLAWWPMRLLAGPASLPPLREILRTPALFAIQIATGRPPDDAEADSENATPASRQSGDDPASQAGAPSDSSTGAPSKQEGSTSRDPSGADSGGASSGSDGDRRGDASRGKTRGSGSASGDQSGQPAAADAATAGESRDRPAGRSDGGASGAAARGTGGGQSGGAGTGSGRSDAQSQSGAGAGQSGGGGGRGASAADGDNKGTGSAGEGGQASGFDTSGPPPKRSDRPATLPPLPDKSSDVVEVTLPPFVRGGGAPGPDPEKPAAPVGSGPLGGRPPVYEPKTATPGTPQQGASQPLQPSQRWPNWIHRLVREGIAKEVRR